jgi:hypothetical protein
MFNDSRDASKVVPIGARFYASDNKLNKISATITQPKSQGASQAMCKYFKTVKNS